MTTAVREAPHHNKLTCYTDYGCRLPECMERKRLYQGELRRKKQEGQPALIDAAPVRQHVLQLQAENVTIYSIAAAAGVDQYTIRALFRSQHRARKNSVSPETARRILAVTTEHALPGYTDGTGTRRRIQALIANGWPVRRVGEQLGVNATYAGELIRRTEQGKPIYLATATKVADAYEAARHRFPEDYGVSNATANRKRNQAKAERWPTPRYWDEHPGDIDDPHFEPMYGITRRLIVAQDANWIIRTTGLSKAAAAERLGVDKSYVDHAFRDHPEYAIEVAA